MKYKVGDKVKVRPDLSIKDYGTECAIEEMLSFKGEHVTISQVNVDDYFIEEDDGQFYWTDEMFLFTNADKIRNMDNEKLAEFINSIIDSEVCVRKFNCEHPGDEEFSIKRIMEWLQKID